MFRRNKTKIDACSRHGSVDFLRLPQSGRAAIRSRQDGRLIVLGADMDTREDGSSHFRDRDCSAVATFDEALRRHVKLSDWPAAAVAPARVRSGMRNPR